MKRFQSFTFILTLTSLASLSQTVYADPENSISVKGQFRLREEGNNKTDLINDRDFGILRVRPVIDFKRDETINVVFTPQFTRILGESTYTIPSNTGVNTKTGTSGGTTDPNFGVHEAYADYHPNSLFAFRGGRMVLSYGDEWLIGGLDWNNVGRSFDGLKARFTYEIGTTDFFMMKITENNTLGAGPGDTNFYGIYNSFSFGNFFKSVDLYFLDQDNGASGSPSELGALGLRIASRYKSFDYKIEYTKEMGSYFLTPSTDAGSAYQQRAELGYSVDSSLKPRVAAEYFAAGKSYNQLYPTSHGWLGIADVLQRRNLTGFDLAASTQITDGLSARVKYYVFSRVDSSASVYKYGGATMGTLSSSNSVGSEWDLNISFQVSKDLLFSGGGALFNSGNYIKDQLGSINPTFYYAQMEVKL